MLDASSSGLAIDTVNVVTDKEDNMRVESCIVKSSIGGWKYQRYWDLGNLKQT